MNCRTVKRSKTTVHGSRYVLSPIAWTKIADLFGEPFGEWSEGLIRFRETTND
jgi:hypothetical protein